MKILDATTIIAVFNEINCPDLIDKILEIGHELVIPSHIMKSELLDKSTIKITEKFVKQEKILILEKNSIEEIREFQKNFPGLGLGECDSMLSCQKLNHDGNKVYCILDDGKARTKASELAIEYTGLIGLLKLIKDRNIMSSDEINEIIIMLKKSNFRFLQSQSWLLSLHLVCLLSDLIKDTSLALHLENKHLRIFTFTN